MRLLSGRNLRARLTQPADELWDRRLGVSTFGYHPGSGDWGSTEWVAHYQPATYRNLFELLRAANVGQGDLFTDLGSGLGRAVFAAAHIGAGRAVGVELVPHLAEAAERIRQRSRLRDKPISFVAADALQYPLADTTVLYSFHSLNDHIWADLLDKLRADRRREGKRHALRVAYLNPVFEHVLANSGWLERIADLPQRRQFLSTAVHDRGVVWQSTDQ